MLDWAAILADLRQEPEAVHETMMCLLKTHEDRARLTREVTERLRQGGVMIGAAQKEESGIGVSARRRLAGFARTLRDNGFRVGLAETRDALAVLASFAASV